MAGAGGGSASARRRRKSGQARVLQAFPCKAQQVRKGYL